MPSSISLQSVAVGKVSALAAGAISSKRASSLCGREDRAGSLRLQSEETGVRSQTAGSERVRAVVLLGIDATARFEQRPDGLPGTAQPR
jgi:hypothetical protein